MPCQMHSRQVESVATGWWAEGSKVPGLHLGMLTSLTAVLTSASRRRRSRMPAIPWHLPLGLRWQEKEPSGFGINNQLEIIAEAEASQSKPSRVSSE